MKVTKEAFDKHIQSLLIDLESADLSFYEEYGDSVNLEGVVGKIALNFQSLEDELSEVIIQMIGTEKRLGDIVTAELSFRHKVNLFGALYHALKVDHHFNTIPGFEEDYFKALLKAIGKCEELRNQVLHSTFDQSYKTEFRIIQKKISARAKRGLTYSTKEVNIPYLFNIADYIVRVYVEVEEFFYDFKKVNVDN